MTKIEVAQASVKRRYEEYLKACQRVANLVHEKEERAKANIDKIKAEAEAKIARVNTKLAEVKNHEVEESMRNAVVFERSALGLAS